MEWRFDMGFYDVLKTVSERAGIPVAQIGPAIGRAPSYVSSAAARGSDPSTANAAAMLAACGWSLVAVPSDEVPAGALAVEPPAPSEDAERAALERKRARLRKELAAVDALIG